jgi:hypothetical protein
MTTKVLKNENKIQSKGPNNNTSSGLLQCEKKSHHSESSGAVFMLATPTSRNQFFIEFQIGCWTCGPSLIYLWVSSDRNESHKDAVEKRKMTILN